MSAWMYILRLSSGGLYIGSSADIMRRYVEHISGNACRTTRLDPPKRIVYSEEFVDLSLAKHREAQVKRGDRNETIYMINNYAALKNNEVQLLGPMDYTVFWVRQMYAGTFGIFGHLQMANRGPTIWPFAALSILTFLGFLVRWRPRDAAWIPACLLAIVAVYSLFLLYVVNYPIYLDSGAPGSALTGRYIFPVLGPIYVLSSVYLLRLFKSNHARLGMAVTTAIIFIASDLPYFLLHATPDWFIPLFR